EPPPVLVDPTGLVTYAHPSGTFSLSLPPDWVVNDVSDETRINVEFSPPGSPDPALAVWLLNVDALLAIETPTEAEGEPLVPDDLNNLYDTYRLLNYTAPDLAYQEFDRLQQADGSMRVSFLLESPAGISQHNDFVQINGDYFTALQVRFPSDPNQTRTLSRVVNTLDVNAGAGWLSSAAGDGQTADGTSSQGTIGFAAQSAWINRTGGFEIMGQIVNTAETPIEFVRITARLYDEENRILLEQDDFIASDLVLPGEYTPFSIIFNDGLPFGTVRYELNASARYAEFAARNFYGPQNFGLSTQAEFDNNGLLVISGAVRNEGSSTANLVKVIVTVFDEEQRVVATDTSLVDLQLLAPGESSTFSVSFVEVGGAPNNFIVTAQGIVQE
ncbi:MAG: hypothetical protein GYB68_14180, partial [Chloroflexi bacterium]|nr:hypothetical protein [Chloroflexota bacterium]